MVRNWADFPKELLELCSQHLCPRDLWAFRAVCRSWQSAPLQERSHAPWVMVEDHQEALWRECFCLSCQRVHRVLMPEAKGKTCFSSRGWVFTLGRDWELCMLKNPMSRHNYIIKLPSLIKFPGIESPTTSLDYMVMVIYGRAGRLGLGSPRPKGCFVAVNTEGSILRCDVNGPTPFEAKVIFQMPPRLMHWEHPDLVQPTTGHPLLLSGEYLVQSATGSLLFVFEIDLNAQTYIEVKSLENTSLFLGSNSSFYLEVDEKHRIKPNCIYFADDSWPMLSEEGGGREIGIYHIEDCTTELYFMAMAHYCYSLPLWIEPSF
ncbi:hypothetical protein BT93_L2873 [Corymbia citriodora subsp. variegata]|uniref:F-box domain-containing protein n=1 Tax=Corymbia citriodora subsp. variegata TaxID=360336 RepID=A0A8T0CIK6_CORYI|nr:hypothetical protein BT93_L2873 [Corymbia citriodora subsp. variegata]